jgi:hypothetical protein
VSGWQAKLSSLGIGATITVHHSGAATVTLPAQTLRGSVGALSSATFPVMLTGFSASRADLSQTLSLGTANLSFAAGASALNGTVLLQSSSATFTFEMLLSFPDSALADVVLGCAGARLSPP